MNYPDDSTKVTENKIGYDIAGNVRFTRDALNHQTTISYSDSFSADGINLDAPRSFSTFAYPTIVTNADGFSSTVRYHYDIGAKTRVEGPPPDSQPNGIIQTFTYDSAARLERVTTLNNGAYTHYEYGPNYVKTFTTINNVAADYHFADLYATQVFDGVGRVTAASGNHPGSTGGYTGQLTVYDSMGRAVQQTNPTEITGAWVPVGDDAGWQYNNPTLYDWKGRPRRVYNMDGTYKEASYIGCGCAGGEKVTLTDEMNRQQNIYSDVLGRTWKTEVMTWPDENYNRSVYSTTVSVYNARDQVKLVNQYSGTAPSGASSTNEAVSCPDGSCQKTTLGYDGYGRLKTRHVPEQQVDPNNSASTDHTTWAYNSDDTVQSVTDARGVTVSPAYNGRHLLTSVTYPDQQSLPAGVAPASNVSFGYDAARNRTSMTDGLGSQSYNYSQLSQMTSETRNFTGVGSFTLSYDYNLAGELTTVSDPWAATVNYVFDSAGGLNSVGGTGFGSVSQFLSNLQYRAWGTLKSASYGNGLFATYGYNSRLQLVSTELRNASNQPQMSATYQYYSDGALKFSQNALDERFDRAFAYDHVSRPLEAYSGSEARDFIDNTNSGTPTGGYRQSYQYSPFSQLTEQVSRIWSDNQTISNTFLNNRREGWSYDANGQIATADNTSFTRDASGQTINQSNESSSRSNKFDGDGRIVWTSLTRPGFHGFQITTANYYLGATPLGGLAVAELSSNGQKTTGNVYVGGRKLAEANGTYVTFAHEDPITGSRGDSTTSGSYGLRSEYNADGIDIGVVDPATFGGGSETPEPVFLGGSFGLGSSCSNADPTCVTCYLDGIEQPDCGHVAQLIDNGAAVPCPDNDCGPRSIWDPNAQRFVGVLPLSIDPNTGLWTVSGTIDIYLNRPITIREEDSGIIISSSPGSFEKIGTRDVSFSLGGGQQPGPGSFWYCFRRWGLRGTNFNPDAANVILDAVEAEKNISPELLAYTWMKENSDFSLDPLPNTNGHPEDINQWDVGPFHINVGWTMAQIHKKEVSLAGLNERNVLGYNYYRSDMKTPANFSGVPVSNARMAARRLNYWGGSDEHKATMYTKPSSRADRQVNYRSWASKFRDFFNCYQR